MRFLNSERRQSAVTESCDALPAHGLSPWLAGLALAALSVAACSSSQPSGNGSGTPSSSSSGTGSSGIGTPGGGSSGGGSPGGGSSGGSPATDDGGSSGGSSSGGNPGTDDGGSSGGSTDGGTYPPLVPGLSCLSSLNTLYVQRTDGIVLVEAPPEQPVLDSTTGMPLSGVVSLQEGANHGCAALSDGSVQCWQQNASSGNTSGQLGNGTTMANSVVYRATPVLTAANTPLTNVASVANGLSNTACAVTSDGKAYCWGDLSWIVKNGTTTLHTGYAQALTTDGSTPLTGVDQLALSYSQACALIHGASAEEVWCWGANRAGELGQGDKVNRQYPTKVLGLTNPTWVVLTNDSFQNSATVCVQDGSSVRCWGSNYHGQVGVNSTTDVQSPTVVVNQAGTAVDGVVDVQPGTSAFSLVRSDGTIWLWGQNFGPSATNYGITNVVAIGYAGGANGNGPRYITSDGIYHNAMGNITVNCGAL